MSACVWQVQKHNGKRNTNVRLLCGCYNAAHAARSNIPAPFMRENKNAAVGLVRPHSGIAYLITFVICSGFDMESAQQGYNVLFPPYRYP